MRRRSGLPIVAVVLVVSAIIVVTVRSRGSEQAGGGSGLSGVNEADDSLALRHGAAIWDSVPLLGLSRPSGSPAASDLGRPEFDLSGTSSIVELDGGEVLTYSRRGARLLSFDPAGRPASVLGTRGTGPGQFMRASGLVQVAPDTAMLVDPANLRINWVTAGDGVVRTTPLAPGFPQDANHVGGVLPDGRVLLTTIGMVRPGIADSTTRPEAMFYLVGPSGEAAFLTTRPDRETRQQSLKVRRTVSTGPRAVALGVHASAVVWGNVIAIASDREYRIELLDGTGARVGEIAYATPRRAVTSAMRDAVVAQALEDLNAITEPVADRQALEREARATPVADTLPTIDRLMVSTDGVLWVLDPIAPGDSGWTATGFRPDGSVHARLRADRVGEPLLFAAEYVVLREEDADGVVTLRRYRFEPSP